GAIVDSFGLDDPYPGYGKVHRRLAQARGDFRQDLETVREALSELKEESLGELDGLLDKMQLNLKRLDEAISHKETVKARLGTAFLNVDNSLDALIQQFRTSNRVHRKTAVP